MFEIDTIHQDKFVKAECTLLVSLSPRKEVDIEPFDFRLIFGDENILGNLDVWHCLYKAFPTAYTQFINAHPDRDFELSNPMLVRIGLHSEVGKYLGRFELYLDEETGINEQLTDDDKAVLLRAFYEFDDNIRLKHGLRLTPIEEKQKLYDHHFDVDAVPYIIHESTPVWEERPQDPDIELVDITDEMRAHRKEIRELRRLHCPTPADKLQARKYAENLLALKEIENPPIDYNQLIFRGHEAIDVMDSSRYDNGASNDESINQFIREKVYARKH